MLHTWKSKPSNTNRLFRRALAMRAILWAARIPRASMAAQAALTCALATLWRVHGSLVCVTAPTDGRENRYPQVYARAGLERCPPAHKMGDLSRLARTPARLRIRSVHATEVFCQPRSAHIARTPISLFNCHGRR